MRYWIQALGVAAFIILFGLIQWGRQSGGPRAGDTVMPQLERPIVWTAGTPGELGIRLYAMGADDRTARLLDFGAIPPQANPLAQITFYEDDRPLGSLEAALSHRC
jgi:hypothetical protein